MGFSRSSSFCLIVLLALASAVGTAWGEDKSSSDYQPAIKPEFQRYYLGNLWPKFTVSVDYRPAFMRMNQSLPGAAGVPEFSLSSFSSLGANAGVLVEFSNELQLEVSLSAVQYILNAQSLGTFTLSQSTTTFVVADVVPHYCFFSDDDDLPLKICPGAGAGVDGIPILSFVNNTSLSMNSFTEAVGRADVKFIYPFSTQLTGLVQTGYDRGFLNLTNGFHSNSYYMIWGNIGIDWLISSGLDFGLNAVLQDRQTSFVQTNDTWDSQVLTYAFSVGYRYHF